MNKTDRLVCAAVLVVVCALQSAHADIIWDDVIHGCDSNDPDGNGFGCMRDGDGGDTFLFRDDQSRPWFRDELRQGGIKYFTKGNNILLDDTNDNNQVHAIFNLERDFVATRPTEVKARIGVSRTFIELEGLSAGSTGTIDLLFTYGTGRSTAVISRELVFSDTDTRHVVRLDRKRSRAHWIPPGPGTEFFSVSVLATVTGNTNPDFRMMLMFPQMQPGGGIRGVMHMAPEPSLGWLGLLVCIGAARSRFRR